jgi:hypothetical protein
VPTLDVIRLFGRLFFYFLSFIPPSIFIFVENMTREGGGGRLVLGKTSDYKKGGKLTEYTITGFNHHTEQTMLVEEA